MEALRLGFSPCPNDTFIFYALVHGRVESPVPLEPVLEDVETLNRWALEGRLPSPSSPTPPTLRCGTGTWP